MNIFRALLFVVFGFALVSFAIAQDVERKVKGSVLRSAALPEIKLKASGELRFAGSHKFVLAGSADAEQFFFIEARKGKIKRLLMVQFEGLKSGVSGSYNYSEPNSVIIGGERYLSNSEFVPNVEMALRALPDSDIAKAAAFLGEKKYVLMNSLVYQRFVRVVDDEKRREIILLYVEDASDLASKPGIEDRALRSFRVIR